MKRNPEVLADSPFDVLVIGGGIHGAAIFREAAACGFRTALIEQGDFGQGTSSNSLKIIHGGLRYLQQADFKRVRQSILSRRSLMAFAPHLIVPQPFLIPVYGHGIKGKEALTLALTLNDLFGWDRNRHLPDDNFLPPGRVLSATECLHHIPHLDKKGLTGGALWYDGLVQHTERLTLELIWSGWGLGGAAVNYVRARGLLIEAGQVQGISAEEVFSRTEFPIRARMVINASGPWLNSFLEHLPRPPRIAADWVKGLNLIVRRPLFKEYGIGLKGVSSPGKREGSRFFFFVPWHGQTMIGTAYTRYSGPAVQARMEESDLEVFLKKINTLCPPAQLTRKEVSFYHLGLQPVSEGQALDDPHPDPDRHSVIYDHESHDGLKGLISVKSTKYTTAPLSAEKVLKIIRAKWKMSTKVSPLFAQASVGGKKSVEDELRQVALPGQGASFAALAAHFWENYGPRSREVIRNNRQTPGTFCFISANPFCTADEVVYGLREEMAQKLSDIVFRRTSLAQGGLPSLDVLRQVAQVMSLELGWDEKRQQREIEEVVQVYHPLGDNQ
jgi:glycerol-3-phosphate dehydrogenase